MAGYPYQNVACDASISVDREPWTDDDVVTIEVTVGESCNVSLDMDAETAWHFAWKVIEATHDASPELIGALTERLHQLGGAS